MKNLDLFSVRVKQCFVVALGAFLLLYGTGLVAAKQPENATQRAGSNSVITIKTTIRGKLRMFELSIDVSEKKFQGQKRISVDASIKNLSDESVELDDLGFVSVFLSKHGKYELGLSRKSETFVGYVGLKPEGDKTRKILDPGKVHKFEFDLSAMGWNDFKLSVRTNQPLTKIPNGEYRMFVELSILNDEESTNWDKRFRFYYSNEIAFEICHD